MAADLFSVVVVGTDGSPLADHALDRAAKLAGASGARLHIVAAYHDSGPFRERLGSSAKVDLVDLRRVAEEVLARAAAHAGRHGVEAAVEAHEGDAAEVLLRVAEERGADLIVVGSRGLSAAQRFLLGSVSHKVAHHAKSTVMIVRRDD